MNMTEHTVLSQNKLSVISSKTLKRLSKYIFREYNLMKFLQKIDLFELGVSVVITLIALYLSLPIFTALSLDSNYIRSHNEAFTSRSLLYSLTGILFFIIGYWLIGRSKLKERSFAIFKSSWNHRKVFWAFLMVFSAGFMTKVYRIISGSHRDNLFLDPADPLFYFKFAISLNMFHFMALGIAFTYYFVLLSKGDPRVKKWAIIAWGTFIFEIICGLLTFGSRMAIVIPILLYLITRHYLFDQSKIKLILIGLLVLFVIFPVKIFLRDVPSALNHYFGSDKEVYTYHKTLSQKDVFYTLKGKEILDRERLSKLDINTKNVWEFSADSSFGRIGQSHIFSAIIEQTQKFLYGRNLLYVFNQVGIPNSIIEKISGIGPGTEFAQVYGLTNESLTGVGPTNMGDWYLNFGFVGIILGMLLMGIFYRFIFSALVNSPSPSGILIYSIMWFTLVHGLEQSLSAVYGKALQLFIILLVIHFFIRDKKSVLQPEKSI